MNKLVFVYGSLKKGSHNHGVLGDSKMLGRGNTVEKFTMLDLGSYPAVIDGDDYVIQGELYEVRPLAFESVEFLEGYPEFYNRKETPIILEDGTQHIAYMYFIEDSYKYDNVALDDGVWEITHDWS